MRKLAAILMLSLLPACSVSPTVNQPAAATISPEQRGLALFYAHQYAQCAQVLEPAMRDPANADRCDLLAALGESQLFAGQYESAIANLQRLAELLPENGDAWLSLAAAQMKNGDTNGAAESLRRCAELHSPDGDVARQMISSLDLNN